MAELRARSVLDLPTIVASQALTQVAVTATTVFLHRGLAHRAVTFRRPTSLLLRTSIWLTTGIKCREWAAVHRCHHAHTDEPQDPHSPAQRGFWNVFFRNRSMYRKAAADKELVAKYSRDLPETALDRYVFDNSKLGLALLLVLLIRILGPVRGVAAAFLHAFTYLRISALINAWGHQVGKRPHDNSGTNSQWLAAVSAGEGLHNNHHHMPTSPRFADSDSGVDPGWWLIRGLRAIGQIKTLRDPDALGTRAA